MRRRLPLLVAVCVLSVLGLSVTQASAAPVTLFGHDGRTRTVDNPYLTGPASNPRLPAAPVAGPLLRSPASGPVTATPNGRLAWTASAMIAHVVTATKSKYPQTFSAALLTLLKQGQITGGTCVGDMHAWNSALAEQKSVAKWRATQLGDVTALLNELAARGQVTAARLPALITTLQRNAQYWKTGKSLVYPDRVQFTGSELVWEYYPGYGLQFQVLGTFGEGDGYYESGKKNYAKLTELMTQVMPMAVRRAGGLAWEYYFNWEGGAPPWVSAMAQATGLEALTNAYVASGNRTFLSDAHQALPLLETKPPTGVAVATSLGTRYLQYSFTPGTDIINAYLQSLLGLYDYGQVSQDATALRLYKSGTAQAQAEVRSFIIGGWSLYQPGEPDDLNYHELVTGFLKLLCQYTQVPVYCTTYQAFESDLLTKPQLTVRTVSAAANKKFDLSFQLSKYADVGVTLSGNGKNYLYTKKYFYSGVHSFSTPKLKAGSYSLAMSVTDPAGNYGKLSTTFNVCNGGCPTTAGAALPTTGAVTPATVAYPKQAYPPGVTPPSTCKVVTTTTTTPTVTGTTTTGTGTTTTGTGTTTTGTTTTGTTTTGTTTTGTTTTSTTTRTTGTGTCTTTVAVPSNPSLPSGTSGGGQSGLGGSTTTTPAPTPVPLPPSGVGGQAGL